MQILVLHWEKVAASLRGQCPWKTKEGNEDLYFIHSEQKKISAVVVFCCCLPEQLWFSPQNDFFSL